MFSKFNAEWALKKAIRNRKNAILDQICYMERKIKNSIKDGDIECDFYIEKHLDIEIIKNHFEGIGFKFNKKNTQYYHSCAYTVSWGE